MKKILLFGIVLLTPAWAGAMDDRAEFEVVMKAVKDLHEREALEDPEAYLRLTNELSLDIIERTLNHIKTLSENLRDRSSGQQKSDMDNIVSFLKRKNFLQEIEEVAKKITSAPRLKEVVQIKILPVLATIENNLDKFSEHVSDDEDASLSEKIGDSLDRVQKIQGKLDPSTE